MRDWPFDTGVDPDYPLYTRGNAGEVLPDVVSPLQATLIMPTFEAAFRRVWVQDWPVIDEPPGDATFAPLIGGRFYLNLAVLRRAADMSSGTSPEEIDHQFFAVGIKLAPYERPDEPDYAERGRLVDEAVNAMLQELPADAIAEQLALGRQRRKEGRRLRSTARSPGQLLARVVELVPEIEDALYWHLVVSGMSSVAFGAVCQGLRAIYGESADDRARRALSGLGAVESAEPGRRVAELAALDDEAFDAAFATFLEEFGFRGVNEWEISAQSWDQSPDVVARMVAAARAAPPKPDPRQTAAAARAELERDGVPARWAEYPFWLSRAEFYVANRERTKAAAVMLVNEVRLDLAELGRLLEASGALDYPNDVFLLAAHELAEAVSGQPVPRGAIEERALQMLELRGVVAPLVVEAGRIPPLSAWTKVADAGDLGALGAVEELVGVAGSPGVAQGRVRVVLDPYTDEPPSPGEVLVAPITDPGWTPMFVAAEAVVVEVGGELSHAVIVARELGIPAVVAAAGCTRVLQTGDLVEVDGSAGTVRVIQRL